MQGLDRGSNPELQEILVLRACHLNRSATAARSVQLHGIALLPLSPQVNPSSLHAMNWTSKLSEVRKGHPDKRPGKQFR